VSPGGGKKSFEGAGGADTAFMVHLRNTRELLSLVYSHPPCFSAIQSGLDKWLVDAKEARHSNHDHPTNIIEKIRSNKFDIEHLDSGENGLKNKPDFRNFST
jgi:hypothetical protein